MTETRTITLTPASHIKSSKQRFVWDPYIPLGTVSIFAGRGGEGKSSFALYLASQIQAGQLPGDLQGEPRSVLIIGHEDDWGTVMKPRLVAAGADLDSVYKVAVRTVEDEVTRETVPAFPLDIDSIRRHVEDTNAGLIIIDPITSTIDGDLHKVADVRRALDPLMTLAQETRSAVIAIMHFNKGAGHISDKVSGSHAFRDASRSLLVFATDDETGQRVATLEKSSYSVSRGTSFAFNLVSVEVETDDGETTNVARVEYLGETDANVSEILNRGNGEQTDADSTDLGTFILEVLLEQGGSAKAAEVIKAAKDLHFSDSQIHRARTKAGVISRREGFGRGSAYYWIHPDHRAQLRVMDSTMDHMDSHSRERESMESKGATTPTMTPLDLAGETQ